LSYPNGRPPKEDGIKLLRLERPDGIALLGYAGLGASLAGLEPSDWMNAVLRNSNAPLQETLLMLASAVRDQIPHQLLKIPGLGDHAHTILAPSLISNGTRPCLFAITLNLRARTNDHQIIVQRLPPRIRIGVAGSATPYVLKNKPALIKLQRLVKAHERGRLSASAVADAFSKFNLEMSRKDSQVGPRCIVAWYHSKQSRSNKGGNYQFYDEDTPDHSPGRSIPMNSGGIEMNLLGEALLAEFLKRVDWEGENMLGQPMTQDELNKLVADLPKVPTVLR